MVRKVKDFLVYSIPKKEKGRFVRKGRIAIESCKGKRKIMSFPTKKKALNFSKKNLRRSC